MHSLIIHFGIKKYELSLTIDIGLLHMYHLSLLPPKQHTIPLIVSRQISIPNVSPNLTDAHIGPTLEIRQISRTALLERGSSVVECRTRNRESPRSLGIFVLFTTPQSTQLYK